ncbi:MAG: hypothetical protein KDA75_22005 [Planctomycetaceae bacterium]|nr:hypothetical protein [Planctomycetaceae bacterium]
MKNLMTVLTAGCLAFAFAGCAEQTTTPPASTTPEGGHEEHAAHGAHAEHAEGGDTAAETPAAEGGETAEATAENP